MIEEELKELILKKYYRMLRFSNEIGLSNSTVVSVLKRGVKTANKATLVAMCDGLNIEYEELIQGRIVECKPKFNPIYEALSEENKAKVIEYMEFLTYKEGR